MDNFNTDETKTSQEQQERRAERRIVEQVTRVLADKPGRTMQEIAEVSGIGRATLYRHFRTREDLIAAISRQAIEEAGEAIARSRLEEGTAPEAMSRLVAALIQTGDRYRLLAHELFPTDRAAELEARMGLPLYALAERGQREGVFDPSLTPRWIITAMVNLVLGAIESVQAGDLARNHAAEIVMRTFMRGIGTSP